MSGSNGRSASASTSSTASARPRCCTSSSSNQPGELRYGTSGVAVPGYELRLVDDKGADVADGEIGELLVRGPTRRRGLLEPAREVAPHLRGRMDAHRRQIRARGRRHVSLLRPHRRHVQGVRPVGLAVRGGVGADPHPRVLEAAVVPKEDGDGLLKPKAYRTLKDGAKRRRAAARGAEGAREAADRPVEISALDRVRREPAEDRDGEDPAVQAEGLNDRSPTAATSPSTAHASNTA